MSLQNRFCIFLLCIIQVTSTPYVNLIQSLSVSDFTCPDSPASCSSMNFWYIRDINVQKTKWDTGLTKANEMIYLTFPSPVKIKTIILFWKSWISTYSSPHDATGCSCYDNAYD